LIATPNTCVQHIIDFFRKIQKQTNSSNCYDDILVIEERRLLGKYPILDLINLLPMEADLSKLLISEVMNNINENFKLDLGDMDLAAASKLILKYNLKCLPLIDQDSQAIKAVTLENLIEQLNNELEHAQNELTLEKQYNSYLQFSLNGIKEELQISIKPHIQELINTNKKLQRAICDRIATEAQLLQTTSELQEIFQAFPDVYIRVDIFGKILSFHGSKSDICFLENDNFSEKSLTEIFPLDIAKNFQEKINQISTNQLSNTLEYSIIFGESCKYFEARFFASLPEQIIVIIRDITERKESQISLQNAKEELEDRVKIRTSELSQTNQLLRQEIIERNLIEKRYARAIHAGKVGAWEWNIHSDEIYIENNLKNMLGYPQNTIINDLNSWLNFIHPDDIELVKAELNACVEGLIPKYEIEHRMLSSNNEIIWFLARGSIVKNSDGKLSFIAGSNTDITEKKEAENKLINSLKEKEILLKEIHHRVKNNLQIISSLLRLQAGYTHDKQSLRIFNDSQSRIRAMAMIHENLYQSNDLERIDFYKYVSNLTTYISRCYGLGKDLKITLDIDDIALRIDTAIPCGLIINELVSNSIKHALIDQTQGNIHIEFNKIGNHKYSLTVSDNGKGILEDAEIRLSQSMGLQLVWNLVEQLEGSITYNTKLGTLFTIIFVEQN
jgi:PAS domain S-box-containing protein